MMMMMMIMMMIMVVVMVVGSEPQSGYLQKKTKAPILSKHFFGFWMIE